MIPNRTFSKESNQSFNSAEEALDHYNMKWIAEEHEMITGSGVPVVGYKALVRNDNNHILGVVGSNYQPIQNNIAFAMFDSLCKKYGAQFVKAKEIDGGSRVYLQARLKTGEVNKGDIIENRITIINSFDGSHGFSIYNTPYRLICLNGMKSAVKSEEIRFHVRHTKNAQNRYEEAFRVFNLAQEDFNIFLTKQRLLADKMIDNSIVIKLIKDTFEISEEEKYNKSTGDKMNKVYQLFHSGLGNQGKSLYDFTNGVTEFVDHYSRPDDTRDSYSIVGKGAKLKSRALELAYNMAGIN